MEVDPLVTIRAVAAKYDGSDHEAERLAEAAARRLEYRKRHGGKECSGCHETKPVSEFGRDVSRPDGLRRYCRACVAAYDADRRQSV